MEITNPLIKINNNSRIRKELKLLEVQVIMAKEDQEKTTLVSIKVKIEMLDSLVRTIDRGRIRKMELKDIHQETKVKDPHLEIRKEISLQETRMPIIHPAINLEIKMVIINDKEMMMEMKIRMNG